MLMNNECILVFILALVKNLHVFPIIHSIIDSIMQQCFVEKHQDLIYCRKHSANFILDFRQVHIFK